MRNKKTIIFNALYKRAHGGGFFWNTIYKLYTECILGCDIPSSTIIGDNFEIFHSAHASVVSPGTIIGKNVSLRQNTTIGAKGFDSAEKSPIIEDEVTIGPNVCIIGSITIGRGGNDRCWCCSRKRCTAQHCCSRKSCKNIRERYRLKYIISLTPPISWYLAIRKQINDKRLYKLRKQYIPDIRKLITPDTSIISSNCFAGRIMQDLGMQYNTPTLGLYFFADDFIEFLSNLKYYLTEAKLEFLDESRYPLGNERRAKWTHWYPIGLLGGKVEIQFLHYHTAKEAAEKWYRRAQRVNFDKLMVIGMEQNLCTIDNVKAFDKLPFEKKIFFSTKNILNVKSNCFLNVFAAQGEVGDPYQKGDIFYKELINRFNNES